MILLEMMCLAGRRPYRILCIAMGHACEDLSFFLNVPCNAQDVFVDSGGGGKVPLSVVDKQSLV